MTAMTPLIDLPAPSPNHPARYTRALLLSMAQMLRGRKRILDPFGGTGGVFELGNWLPDARFDAVEIEPEFAAMHPKTTLGNALALPWPANTFDAIATSPVYGNRMSDTLLDGYDRITYTARLGRKLHSDNAGQLQWGDKYKVFHRLAWTEARRVLQVDGTFVLNSKDHIRDGQRRFVTLWHLKELVRLGFTVLDHQRLGTPSMRYGRNADLRVKYEDVVKLRLDRPCRGADIPAGLCQCGCGQPTTIHRGQPRQYLRNHHYPIAETVENVFLSWLPDAWSDNDCWQWQGTTGTGRATLWFRDKQYIASRVAYEIAYGQSPGDLDVCHTCDNPLCVNPAHLFLGDDRENMADKTEKGRQAKGEGHGMAKLTEGQAIAIREAFLRDESRKALAEKYGVAVAHIYSIGNGRTWKHLERKP